MTNMHHFLLEFSLVKDSFSFCKDLSEMEPKFYMTSFDMESLFTNVPLDEAISINLDLLFERKKKFKVYLNITVNNL